MSIQDTNLARARVVAIVSGKGGSGKTMVTAMMARIVGIFNNIAIIDADTGTAGLSYYLGLKSVDNISVGLTELMLAPDSTEPSWQPIHWPSDRSRNENSTFLSIGNHRRLYENISNRNVSAAIAAAIRSIRHADTVFVDCRGGIDSDSLAVCELADDVVLITEPDTTSFQASQHVVDILTLKSLSHKLRGFYINKVFDDPTAVARTGTSVFRCRCLGAIPFDLDATRAFLVGNVPSPSTQFATQIWAGLPKIVPSATLPPPFGRCWDFPEFSNVALTNPDGARGGTLMAATLLAMSIALVLNKLGILQLTQLNLVATISVAISTGILGSLEPTRKILGRAFRFYIESLTRILTRPR